MTNEELLRQAGLTDSEIDEMSDIGSELQSLSNPNAAYKLAQMYNDVGLTDEVDRVLNVATESINYYTDLIQEVTGREITFNDSAQRWYATDTGQFVQSPYGDLSNINYMVEDDLNDSIMEKYG